jgi:hypothetical protein
LTAFRPIPARQAAELIEAAGIPDARRLLIDSAAADLVKAYALVMETIEQRGAPKVDRGSTIPVHVMQRVMSQGVADNLWSGGTVRLPGSDLIGGMPEVNLTTVGFSERDRCSRRMKFQMTRRCPPQRLCPFVLRSGPIHLRSRRAP